MADQNNKLINKNDFYDYLAGTDEETKQYYADLSKKIINLLKENKTKEAIDLIEEETNRPYVPDEVLVYLTSTKSELECELKHLEYENEIKSLNELEIWNKIYNEVLGTFDFTYYITLLEKKEDQLDELDYSMIRKVFLNKKVSNINKVSLAMSLIDRDFKAEFYNNLLDKKFNIDFKDVNNLNLPDKEIANELEDVFMKEPSKFHLSVSVIQLLYAWFFPQKIPFKQDEIVKSIINIIENSFGNEDIEENEITDIIKKMLELQNEEK